jgi:hypothetical protein
MAVLEEVQQVVRALAREKRPRFHASYVAEQSGVPAIFSSYDYEGGEPFDVTPEMIWVTFSPSESLLAEADAGPVGRRFGHPIPAPLLPRQADIPPEEMADPDAEMRAHAPRDRIAGI